MSPGLGRLSKACFLLLLSSPLLAEEAKPRLYRIDDNVYRGPQPTRQDISNLASNGIRTVLDLRGALDRKGWEQQAVEAAGMKYVRVGLSGFFPPTQNQMNKILAVLQNPDLTPVFVHCRRGADRSGVVIACYRICHDHWTNAQAMQEARQQGFSGFEILMLRYVLHFKSVAPPVEGDPHWVPDRVMMFSLPSLREGRGWGTMLAPENLILRSRD